MKFFTNPVVLRFLSILFLFIFFNSVTGFAQSLAVIEDSPDGALLKIYDFPDLELPADGLIESGNFNDNVRVLAWHDSFAHLYFYNPDDNSIYRYNTFNQEVSFFWGGISGEVVKMQPSDSFNKFFILTVNGGVGTVLSRNLSGTAGSQITEVTNIPDDPQDFVRQVSWYVFVVDENTLIQSPASNVQNFSTHYEAPSENHKILSLQSKEDPEWTGFGPDVYVSVYDEENDEGTLVDVDPFGASSTLFSYENNPIHQFNVYFGRVYYFREGQTAFRSFAIDDSSDDRFEGSIPFSNEVLNFELNQVWPRHKDMLYFSFENGNRLYTTSTEKNFDAVYRFQTSVENNTEGLGGIFSDVDSERVFVYRKTENDGALRMMNPRSGFSFANSYDIDNPFEYMDISANIEDNQLFFSDGNSFRRGNYTGTTSFVVQSFDADINNLAFDSTQNSILVSTVDGNLYRVQNEEDGAAELLLDDRFIFRMALDPVRQRLYFTEEEENAIFYFDLLDEEVRIATEDGLNQPGAIAVDPSRNRIFAANRGDESISFFEDGGLVFLESRDYSEFIDTGNPEEQINYLHFEPAPFETEGALAGDRFFIDQVTPLQVEEGQTIEIFGQGFSSTIEENEVFIGHQRATILEANSVRLEVELPEGLGAGKVFVNSNGKSTQYPLQVKRVFDEQLSTDETSFISFFTDELQAEETFLEVADFDNDGLLDLLVIQNLEGLGLDEPTLKVYLNDGNGGFGPLVESTIQGAQHPKIGDFDADGNLDILLSIEGVATVLAGNGDGSFTEVQSVGEGAIPEPADLLFDGRLDVVVNNNPGSVYRIVRDFFGDPLEVNEFLSSYGHGNVKRAISKDMNGDFIQDLVLLFSDRLVIFFLNDEAGVDGTDVTDIVSIKEGGSNGLDDMVLADIRGEGQQDLVVLDAARQSLFLFYINEEDAFDQEDEIDLNNPSGMKIADLDGDGLEDILVFSENESLLQIFINEGNGSFPENPIEIVLDDFDPISAAVGDFLGNGEMEIALTSSNLELLILRRPLSPPSAPSNLNFSAQANSISGSFSPSSGGASGYLVVRALDGEAVQNPEDDVFYEEGEGLNGLIIQVDEATSFLDEDLILGESYEYFIFAYRISGPQIVYQTEPPLTGEASTAYPDPETAQAENLSGTGFEARWTEVEEIEQVLLEVSDAEDFSSLREGYDPLVVNYEPGLNSALVEGLRYSTDYFYRFRYVISEGDSSDYSDIRQVRTLFSEGIEQDSLAMVDLYELVGGSNWSSSENWLEGRTDNWEGIQVEGDRIREILLSDRNLTGSLPESLLGLDSLQSLDLSNNNLSGLVDLSGLAALTNLDLSNNALGFGDLEALADITVFSYAPQDSLGQAADTLLNQGDSFTWSITQAGENNTYRFTRDGEEIESNSTGVLDLSELSFSDEGSYRYEISNSLLPDLTLFSRLFEVRVSSLERDSIALEAFFNSTIGQQWAENAGWTEQDLSTGWFGVEIENNRVVGLNLSNNNLQGAVPDIFSEMLALERIDLSGNLINDLVDLRALPNLTELNVSDNLLDFSGIEKNLGIDEYNYGNQKDLSANEDTLVEAQSTWSLTFKVGGSANEYQWYKDDETLEEATQATLNVADVGRSDMGSYRVEISSSLAPEVTLNSGEWRMQAFTGVGGHVLKDGEGADGDVRVQLLRVRSSGGYDTTQVVTVNQVGRYDFTEVILDDYIIEAFPESEFHPDHLRSYFESTIFWTVADTLRLNEQEDELDISLVNRPPLLTPADGSGQVLGVFEALLNPGESDEASGRSMRRRVSQAGVSLSRGTVRNRPQFDDYVFDELIAYEETDDVGEFAFENVPNGVYRIDIQYPGFPMDEESFVIFELNDATGNNRVQVVATVEEDKIVVEDVTETSWQEQRDLVQYYPNPVEDVLRIDYGLEDPGSYDLSLYSAEGRVVEIEGMLSGQGKRQELDMSQQASGIYFLRLQHQGNPDQFQVIRIVKAR